MTTTPTIRYPRHPAHLDAYVEVLGQAVAVQFLIAFGGSPLYFPDDPKGKSAAEALIGKDALRALGRRMRSNRARIPMPRPWLILAWIAEGKSVSEICRTLKTTDTNARSIRRAAGALTKTASVAHERPAARAGTRRAPSFSPASTA